MIVYNVFDKSLLLILCCRYTPQVIELDHSLKPFIPDFIPAVGDIDAFLKVCHQILKTFLELFY